MLTQTRTYYIHIFFRHTGLSAHTPCLQTHTRLCTHVPLSPCLAWSLGVSSRLREVGTTWVFLVLPRLYPGLGARRGDVCLAAHAVGCVFGVGPGGEGVQVEDGDAPAVDGQHDDQHTHDVEQESRPGLVYRESV